MKPIAIAVTLLLSLSAAASNDLTGTVLDAASKPVPRAHVYVYTASPKTGVSAFCPSCYRDCGKHDDVDAKGAFNIADLDRTLVFDVLAVADGYEPAFARHVDPSQGPATIHLTPRVSGGDERLITGVVIDPDGKPVVGAIVEPSGFTTTHLPDGRTLPRFVTIYGQVPGVDKLSITDANGAFALRIPDPDGELDVRVTARSFAPRIDRGFRPGQRRTIRLIDGATITGRVTRDGKPVEGARVTFVQKNRASSGFLGRFEIGTSEDGLFVMTNLAPNETYVIATATDTVRGVAQPKLLTVDGDGASCDAGTFAIVRGRRVAGTLVVPEGTPVPAKMRITLTSEPSGDAQEAEVRADGTFAFEAVPDGPTRLIVPGKRGARIDLPEHGDVTGVKLDLDRP
ncbi:MAG TPA: hypothetical protein VJZ00_17035 [Thermoanaerobaculia bacterium]|nr:hypothetical protein [Thermoanaerobaculia bacterium]